MRRHSLRSLLPWIGAGAAISLVVALLDPVGSLFSGWLSYAFMGSLGAAALWATWRWVGGPNSLAAAAAVAVALRLLVGLGFQWGLPTLGYEDSERHREGYFYLDAYRRDLDAWRLAQLSVPLTTAFTDQAESDQYGGLLFLTGGLYRTLSLSAHHPTIPIALTAWGWRYSGVVCLGVREAELRVEAGGVCRLGSGDLSGGGAAWGFPICGNRS